MIKVSVIVTTYNRKEFLEETLTSVLNQSFKDFEIIVVDNNSDYDFLKFIESFKDSRLQAYQNDNSGIIALNRNLGIRKARGKYIAFCDDDDTWVFDKLESQLKYLEQTQVDLVYSNTKLIFENGTEKLTRYKNIDSLNKLLNQNHITLSSVIVKNFGGLFFNEDQDFITVEDYELWIRLMKQGLNFKFIEKPLVNYRVMQSSMSQKSRFKNQIVNIKFRVFLLKNLNLPIYSKIVLLKVVIIRLFRILLKHPFKNN